MNNTTTFMNSARSISSNGPVHTAPHSTPQKATEIGKSPDKEIYGLVGYYCIWLVLALYMVYALVPDGVLRNYGVVLPSKWWGVAIPVYVCSLWVFLLIMYLAVNFYCTPPLDSLDTIRDEFTVHVPFPISPIHQKADPPVDATTDVTSDVKSVGTHPYAIPPVGDISIQQVAETYEGPFISITIPKNMWKWEKEEIEILPDKAISDSALRPCT